VSDSEFTCSSAPSPSSCWLTPTSPYLEGEPTLDLFNTELIRISRVLSNPDWEVSDPSHPHPHTPIEFPPLLSLLNLFGLDPPPSIHLPYHL
jgi:hypothetical protein